MKEFVFLYRGGSRDGSPAEMQQVMQKWMAWFKELGEKGHIKDRGQPLERIGKLVKGDGGLSWPNAEEGTQRNEPSSPPHEN